MIEGADTLNAQAINLASKGEYPEAIACFEKALKIERYNALLWFNLGVTYREAGDLLKAHQALAKAYSLDRSDSEIIETFALINYNLGDLSTATKLCHEGLAKNPDNCHIWNNLGVIYFDNGNYPKACKCFEKAVTINSYYYDALYNLRDTYHELKNTSGEMECERQLRIFSKGE